MERKRIVLVVIFALLISGLLKAETRYSDQNFSDTEIKQTRKVVNSSISLISESYIPGTTVDLVFYYTYSSPDGEWDDGVSLDFPEGVFVNSASVCTTTGSQQLPYNGETGDGAIVTWGNIEGGSGLGGLKSSGEFSVNVTIIESFSGPLSVDWYIAGDGYGSQPNSNSGTIELLKALDFDLAIVNLKPTFVLLGSDFVPVVSVRNVGIEETTFFKVSVEVSGFGYNEEMTITEPLGSNETINVVFPSFTPENSMDYVAQATITEGGGEDESNDMLFVNGVVAPLADAYAINGVTLSYEEINLISGETVNVGTVNDYPWQLAEEFDGNYIYRINHDASIGTVNPDGSFNHLGFMTGVPGYTAALAYNWDTGVMYVVVQNIDTDYSHLCTLDMETYALTEIGFSTQLIVGMDFANDGYLYAVTIQNELLKIDPLTADFNVVGPIGIDIVYPQDVSFDVETGLLYTIASGFTFSAFGTYDLNTGAFQLIADMYGVYYYTLVITKNPNDYNLGDPIIEVNPLEISETLNTNEESTRTIEIKNVGTGTLNYNILVQYTAADTKVQQVPEGTEIDAGTTTSAGNLLSEQSLTPTEASLDVLEWERLANYGINSNWNIRANLSFNGLNWLSISPSSGVLEEEQSEEIVLSINAEELEVGIYAANIRISSNDSDNPLVIVPVTLEVTVPMHTLTLLVNPQDAGTVTGAGEYEEGTVVTVNAAANEGFVFDNWTDEEGNAISDVEQNEITLTSDLTLVAHFVEDEVSVHDVWENRLNIFPNPANDLLAVVAPHIIDRISMFNITGQKVLGVQVSGNEYQLNVAELSQGYYILQVISAEGFVSNTRIMISR